jgi:DNA-binding NarL/FixJ family response regulator
MAQRNIGINLALVADDHGVTRFGLGQFLRSEFAVRTCHEVPRFTEALAFLAENPVDLAIVDLGIPGLASPSDLAQVRQSWPSVKLVVLSGSDQRADILRALEAGVHGYIIKTETMEGLADKLAYVMSGEIYVPACLAQRGPVTDAAARPAPGVPASNAPKLTARQMQVLRAIVRGQSNKQIAKELDLAIGTVKMHVSGLLTALGAQSRSHAANLGRRLLE